MSQTPPRENEPDPRPDPAKPDAAPVAERIEPPSNKQIKAGVRRLIAARVDRKIVQGLRAQARSGQLSRTQWRNRLQELLGIAA